MPAVAPNEGPEVLADSVLERRSRVRLSVEFKRRIVAQAAACHGHGEGAALLRREGLYSSHLSIWREQVVAGTRLALPPKPVGRKAEFDAKNRRVAQLRRESATLAHRVVEKCSGIDRRAGPAGEAVMSAPIVERHPVLPLSAACAALRASRAASHRRRRALVAWRPRPSAVSAWALGADELATVVTLHSLRLVDEPPREIVGCLPAEDTPTCQVPGMGGIERVLAGDYSRSSPATPRRRSHHRRLHRCPTRSFLKSHGSSPAWAQLGGFTRSASKPRAKASARGSSCGQPRGQES